MSEFASNLTHMLERAKGCERKTGYDTIEDARRAALYAWTQSGRNLKVYLCPHCGKYHLTHRLDYKPKIPNGSKSGFVFSPNFTGKDMGIKWDHNNPELRERNYEKIRAFNARESERRKPKLRYAKGAYERDSRYEIDPEKYISGKNRHKHKIQKARETIFCMKCGKPIADEDLDTSRMCGECKMGCD